jgi:FKBP-type peptidyl-prolyl cis-trans isomerase (trigger factor)
MYGASLGEEIERTLVNETLGVALAKANVEPVATPSIDATPPKPGNDFTYKALVEVRPPIALPRSRGCRASARPCSSATTRSSASSPTCSAATRR